jgi:hypothetical protein
MGFLGQDLTATTLAGNVCKRLDATLKHLAPGIPVMKTERGWKMDFEYCLVRGLV